MIEAVETAEVNSEAGEELSSQDTGDSAIHGAMSVSTVRSDSRSHGTSKTRTRSTLSRGLGARISDSFYTVM